VTRKRKEKIRKKKLNRFIRREMSAARTRHPGVIFPNYIALGDVRDLPKALDMLANTQQQRDQP
jgi:hypothetical protein